MDDTRFGDTDDRALAARVAAGDDAAFALLASRHRAALVRYAAHRLGGDRHAAEDAVQDALVKGLAAMRNGKVPEAPRAWLFVIVRNCCVDLGRGGAPTDPLADHLVDAGAPTAERAIHGERLGRVVSAIGDLPASQRTMIVGREFEGRSYEELARRNATTVGAVKSLLVRARRTLAAQPSLHSTVLPVLALGGRLRDALALAGERVGRLADLLAAPLASQGTSVAAVGVIAVAALPAPGGAIAARAGGPDHAAIAPPAISAAAHGRPVAQRQAPSAARGARPGGGPVLDDDAAAVLRACAGGDEHLAGRFTAGALRQALAKLPADLAEYTTCGDAIQRAWMRTLDRMPRAF